MKNLYDEISNLSMADDSDDDVEYEEEVIERDEEYDDGSDDYDDEEYYDDEEEYDDDEGYDDYDEEEEDYDDGYGDQYYDDRLNQVLDELAELKRGMNAPAPVQVPPQQPFAPVQPHVLFGFPQQNNNEVVMYNEISRLRDELAKTQNSQSMHEELSRLKEDMEREKRHSEEHLLDEIKRLNERIEELQQPGGERSVPKSIAGGSSSAGYLPEAPSKELGKLVGINETLLKSQRDSDAHILSDIAEIKTKLDSILGSDVNKALGELNNAVKSVAERPVSADNTQVLTEITAAIAGLKASLDESLKQISDKNDEAQGQFRTDIQSLIETQTQNLAEFQAQGQNQSQNSAGGVIDTKLLNKLARIKTSDAGVDLTEIMRSVYELKGMLGSSDPNQQSLVNMALKAYTDLDLLHATIANSTDFRMKLEAVENFVSSVNAQDFITSDALDAYNIVLKELMDTPLDRDVFDSLRSFGDATGKISVSSSKKDAVKSYLKLSERAKKDDIDKIIDYLPDMVAAINDAENSQNVVNNARLSDDIKALYEELEKVPEADKHAIETEIMSLISELSSITVGDIVTYSPLMPLPTSDAVTFNDGDSVSDRLNMLTATVSDIAEALDNLAAQSAANAADTEAVAATVESARSESDAQVIESGINSEQFEELKNRLTALTAQVNLDELLAEIQRNFAGVGNRLAAIESRLNSVPTVSEDGESAVVYEPVEPVAPAYSSDDVIAAVQSTGNDIIAQTNDIINGIADKLGAADNSGNEVVLQDLTEIKERVADYEAFITQIADLRAEIPALFDSLNIVPQFDKLYDDIVAQIDKLYDDLSAVDGDTAEKILAKIDEVKSAVDAVTSSDLMPTLLDGIVDFRAAYEDSQALSSADRAKLLEDVAFVRSEVENKLSAIGSDVSNSEIYSQITELKDRFDENIRTLEEKIASIAVNETSVTELADGVGEQIAAVSEQIAGVNEQVATVNEQFNGVNEQLAAVSASIESGLAAQNDSIGAVSEAQQSVVSAIEELKEKSAAIENAINLNGLTAMENKNAITEDINRIIELLSPDEDAEDETEDSELNVYDEVNAVAEKVEEIRAATERNNADVMAALADIKEQVHLKELEQSLAAVTATEEEQQTLLTEIAGLRERLSGLETAQQSQAENTAAQLESTSAQLENISGMLSALAESNTTAGLDEETTNDIKSIIDEIADIKSRLEAQTETESDFVRIQDDLTFIRNQIEATIDSVPEDDSISASLESEGMSLIMDDIAAIKEKLAAFDEYDTVAEILSLREDVKTARMLDTNDLAAELEGLKGDLTELKADISDIKSYKADGESVIIGGESGPTSDEVNMLLGEIVSLRDEIQAYKDDVNNMIAVQDGSQPATPVADENFSVVLDELNALHNEIDNIKIENLAEQAGEIDNVQSALAEIKDMISRRTTLVDDGAARESSASGELNVVLDEIINVKDEVSALKADFTSLNETAALERESDAQAERAALADEMQSFKNELYAMIGEKLEELSSVSPDLTEELESVKNQLADLQALALGGIAPDNGAVSDNGAVLSELSEIKSMITGGADVSASNATIDELYGEVAELRKDLESARLGQPVAVDGAVTVDLTFINSQLAELRDIVSGISSATPVAESEPDAAVLGEILTLREEVAALSEQLENRHKAEDAESEPDAALMSEVLGLREELAALREQINDAPAHNEADDADNTVLNEILALREELAALRENGETDNAVGLMESVDAIKEDVRAIKDEPDLSIINEVLALRDEFQAFKDEMYKTRTAPEQDKSKDELIAEVQSLRDQLFAISMANVNDGTGNDVVYESYNNIILDEISSLRDEIALIKNSDETKALGEELSQMKDRLTNLAIDDSEKTEARFEEIRKELAKLKADESDVANNVILEELANLKEELANQREADETTLNFMSEMAHLLERQNTYISEASNERLSDEIESLKSEIASSLSVPAATPDNGAVLKELASIREELNRRDKSDDSHKILREQAEENKKILRELARLSGEIGAISEREPSDDGALSRSINDLKAELSQLSGLVDENAPNEEVKPKKQASSKSKSASGGNKSGKSSGGNKSSGGAKQGTKRKTPAQPKPAEIQIPESDNGLSSDNLLSKIDAVTFSLGGTADDNTLVLNPDFKPDNIPATSEEMDIAARIAKQVANKLIMEQLVQQLGDGNVPRSEVEEIVKDILPQEFTTIQVDEQTDKVRRLANSLVLDKLRSRLKK